MVIIIPKKKEELSPEAKEHEIDMDMMRELKDVASNIDKSIVNVSEKKEDDYYKIVVSNLMDSKDIELKTEYLTPSENFAGSKLAFLATYADIPFLGEWVTMFEKKRVSLQRKSRQEIIMALQEKRQAEEEARQRSMLNMFGMQ